MTWFLLIAAGGYALGSIPTGYLLGKARGIDIRQWGSGATGGTNVSRVLGYGAGVTTGVVDLLKGVAAAYLGMRLQGDWGYAVGGFMAMVGHAYPVWLGFRGGKSVATSSGTVLPYHPVSFMVGLVGFFAAIVPTRYVSLGSLVGTAFFWSVMMIGDAHPAHKWLATGALLLIYVRHWENIKRLAAGTEHKFGQKAKPRTEG